MKVKELINFLSKLPQDLEVLTAIDEEGNGFNHISDDGVSIIKFDEYLDSVHPDDYNEYDNLKDYVVIG